jgi:3-methyl-2-oxobutanoate hydroxymethyltransferase
MSHITIPEFQQHKQLGKKITVVTAYDALFTRIVEQAGLEVILVGDSLGMVVQGKSNTLSVTMEEMLYHTRIVAQAAQRKKCRSLPSKWRSGG